MFTPLLLDARGLWPPTIPHGKADDSLFLALLPARDPGAGYLALPASIGHVDAEPRDRAADANERLLFERRVGADRIAVMRASCAALAEALDAWPRLWAGAGPAWLERIAVVLGR